MTGNMFEGADFKEDEFKALIPKYYPPKYKKYIEEETELLMLRVKGSNRVLEAGVGIGRLIPKLAPLVKEFVGVDNAELMLKKSREIAKGFPNTRIVECDLENLGNVFPVKYFDFSLCVWNTLGNVQDEVKVLKEISKVTKKSICITVYLKGTVEERKNWYKTVGVDIKEIDIKNEVFYSKSGLKSKAYSLEEIEEIAKKSNLKIKNSKTLNRVMLWGELAD